MQAKSVCQPVFALASETAVVYVTGAVAQISPIYRAHHSRSPPVHLHLKKRSNLRNLAGLLNEAMENV
jgi:hypothetical protein